MAAAGQPKPKREYNYGDVIISLENCILPEDKLFETPSMRDGIDRDTETSLRVLACELIQTSGILLKLPQVAMATGQVLLQRFYYSKSFVKHDFEIYAMACIFLAAKIEEAPRRLRDVINVFHHIKQKRSGRPISPMDFFSNTYLSLKNQMIKAERRILKELGFCVHVKHPHKIIITYLQILECEKNVGLAQKAWNYMNDCLRTDVFVKFAPEKIACACIFLAARQLKTLLPSNPPWWELFGSRIDEVEEIALTILKIYARPRISRSKLELAVEKAKKLIQDKKDFNKDGPANSGSFTPMHISPANTTSLPTSKPGSPTKVSPADSTSNLSKSKSEKTTMSDGRNESKHAETRKKIERDRNALGIRSTKDERQRTQRERLKSPTPPKRSRAKSETDSSSESDSDSASSEDKQGEDDSSNEETSSSSGEDTRVMDQKRRRKEYEDSRRFNRNSNVKDRQRIREGNSNENGHKPYDYNKRIRSRSPYKRSKSRSRSRSRERHSKMEKKLKMKKRIDRFQPKTKHDRERHYANNSLGRHDKYVKKIKR